MLTFKASEIKRAVAMCNVAVHRSINIPILCCIKITAKDGVCTFEAINLDVHFKVTGLCSGDGQLAVPAKALWSAVKFLAADEMIRLSLVDNRLVIDMADGRARIMTLDAADFPVLAHEDWTTQASFTWTMKELLSLSSFVSTEETRYYLNGVCLDFEAQKAVATDGHRLGLIRLPAEKIDGLKPIVPRDAIACLRLWAKPDESLAFEIIGPGVAPRAVRVYRENWTADCKLIDGIFPDVQRVIPKTDPVGTWTFDSAGALARIRRLAAFTTAFRPLIRFGVKNNSVVASVDDGDGSTMSVILPGEITGDVDVSYNARYILDVLPFATGNVIISWFGNRPDTEPMRLNAGDRMAVVMPMRRSFEVNHDIPEGLAA